MGLLIIRTSCFFILATGYTVDVNQVQPNIFLILLAATHSRGGINSALENMGQQVQKAAAQAAAQAAATEVQNQLSNALSGFKRK